MKTKIVYVTTCNEKNYYLEQVLMSAYSARLHNPTATILLVTDTDSEKTITGKRAEIRKYINEVLAFECPEGYNNMMKSRYLKTNVRNLIDGDLIYVDSDTVICRPLDELDELKDDVCGINNHHINCSVRKNKSTYRLFEKCGYKFEDEFTYINGGILYAKDTQLARDFFKKWYEEWKYTLSKGCPMDMMSLHQAEVALGYKIKEISGVWNCQVEGACLNYLADAKILHYFSMGSRGSTTSYRLREVDIYERIKESGFLPEDIKEMLQRPLSLFTPNHRIVAGQTLEFLIASDGLQKLYKYFPKIAKALLSSCQKMSDISSGLIGTKMRAKHDK